MAHNQREMVDGLFKWKGPKQPQPGGRYPRKEQQRPAYGRSNNTEYRQRYIPSGLKKDKEDFSEMANDSVDDTRSTLKRSESELSDFEKLSIGSRGSLETISIPEHVPVEFHPRLKPACRIGLESVTLRTNMFPIHVTDTDRIVYRYEVAAEILVADDRRRPKVMSMNKGAKDDCEYMRRCETIRAALQFALESYRVLSESGVTVFDGNNTLFANENLELALKRFQGTLTLNPGQLPPALKGLVSKDATKISINIRPCTGSAHQFTIGEAKQQIADGGCDRSLRQFYELLTNEGAIQNKAYVFYGAGKAFLRREDPSSRYDIGNGQERRQGLTKGVRFIEGNGGGDDKDPFKETRLVAALVLDAKVGSFYKTNSCLESIAALNNWSNPSDVVWNLSTVKRVHRYFNGLRLEVMGTGNTFIASGFDFSDERGFKFRTLRDYEQTAGKGNVQSLQKFIAQGIRIQFPDWPVVVQRIGKGRGKERLAYFPLELLRVCPYQRVPLTKALIKPEKARPPQERWNLISRHLQELDLAEKSPVLSGFGIRVDREPLHITGFRRVAPQIGYANEEVASLDPRKAAWKQEAHYVEGATVNKIFATWAGPITNRSIVSNFLEQFEKEAGAMGIIIGKVELVQDPIDIESEARRVGPVFKKAAAAQKAHGRVIVLYFSNKYTDSAGRVAETKSHNYLKFAEAVYQVVTQHISIETISGKKQGDGPYKVDSSTMGNLLNKFNLKAFGLNYTVVPEAFGNDYWFGSTLFFGYDVAHPVMQSVGDKALGYANENPSVVGFAHNATRSRDAFVGDFAYQEANRERVSDQVLNARVKWILKQWETNRKEPLPENIFIYRDGVSEGQYEMVLKEELAAIQEACSEYDLNYQPKFALVIVTKRHNKRFFKDGADGSVGNPEPLTVIDKEVVRTDLTEMYIQSHHAIQICNMPVSIPEPVYQADEWAKRGTEVVKTYKDLRNALPRKIAVGLTPNPRDRKVPVDWDELTKRLSYMGKALDGIRTNA
ncbi:unnamed protein product, partial [Mesorhabditis spiculigera]